MKPVLTAYSENVLGGIQTFYLNLLSHKPDDETFNIQWLLIDHCDEGRAKAPGFEVTNTKVKYCNKNGRWRKAVQLIKPVIVGEGVILVNREFELDALSLYPPIHKTIYHIVHDDYYLQFAVKYTGIIDAYIAHNKYIYAQLLKLLPEREKDIFFLPFGIRLSPVTRKQNLNRILHIAFIARMDTSKGIHDLCKIDDAVKQFGFTVHWLVIGDGQEKEAFLKSINNRNNFEHLIAKDDSEIFERIQACDIFILPSVHDGTPVALLESMSTGLVPLIYRFNEGIEAVVTPEIGYVVDKNDYLAMAEIIKLLHNNRSLLEEKSGAALNLARTQFNAVSRSKDYFNLFKNYKVQKKSVITAPIKPDSLLEQIWIPQRCINILKKIKSSFR